MDEALHHARAHASVGSIKYVRDESGHIAPVAHGVVPVRPPAETETPCVRAVVHTLKGDICVDVPITRTLLQDDEEVTLRYIEPMVRESAARLLADYWRSL